MREPAYLVYSREVKSDNPEEALLRPEGKETVEGVLLYVKELKQNDRVTDIVVIDTRSLIFQVCRGVEWFILDTIFRGKFAGRELLLGIIGNLEDDEKTDSAQGEEAIKEVVFLPGDTNAATELVHA